MCQSVTEGVLGSDAAYSPHFQVTINLAHGSTLATKMRGITCLIIAMW